ncbi:hypothetical protein BD410DRAFT_873356 [Rickenella mellea]|uniref:DUF4470 domain-containing protein n=1 Tax=Rickenella mellea TaxID=50990 RepID=A0A4Y7PY66_9AGAM|nr:hypothetical protein BD410DRAFT_873356 [Rickenella mellea]
MVYFILKKTSLICSNYSLKLLTGERQLDFTCCDIDPAILARNVLLLTMIAAEQPSKVLWNIFFHMYLDKDTHSLLIEHCKMLIGFSLNLECWNRSPYATFIKMCTEYTLSELRRHWLLYIDMHNLPHERIKTIRDTFTQNSQGIWQGKSASTAFRSAGPLIMKSPQVEQVCADQFKKYWRTGTTFSDRKQIALATLLNPTFVYTLAGEGFNVHYGTDPMIPFHLAVVFAKAHGAVSVADYVKAGITQFNEWCSAFCEATAVCRALHGFEMTGALSSDVPVAQWKVQLIQLSKDEYTSNHAPAVFNVIDTSNLNDHIGLLNVLIASIPLLLRSPRSGVLYTESLLFRGEDATKEFTELLHADITTISILFDLCPVDYLSRFTSRSNIHELMYYQAAKGQVSQFHHVTAWKSPTSGDFNASLDWGQRRPPVFEPYQLGSLLYDIYHQTFEQEDSSKFYAVNQRNISKAISHSDSIHYMRESFVLLLKLVRDRLAITKDKWKGVMDRFFNLRLTDTSMPMDRNNTQELLAQMHRHGIYTNLLCDPSHPGPKIGRFSGWDIVPPLVRIILTIPREDFTGMANVLKQSGTPVLECHLLGSLSHNMYRAIHVAFGRVIHTGTKTHPCMIFEEDRDGWRGDSPLVVSFTVPSRSLTDIEPPKNLKLSLGVGSTPNSTRLVPKLGLSLHLFTANLMDESLVHVLPEPPLPTTKPRTSPPTSRSATSLLAEIGSSGAAVVTLDDECELVASMSSTVFIEDEAAKLMFGSGITPNVAQVSPCVMRITVGSRRQDIIHPFPVVGSMHKLRLARKSLYVEVIVPVSGPFTPEGMNLNRFAVVGVAKFFCPWILDISAAMTSKWLDPHVSSMMSSRERSLRKKQKEDVLMFVKDTLFSIFVRSSGIRDGPARRLFALRDTATNNCDTIIFISDLRFDLQCHTMICDGFVLPLTRGLLLRIQSDFAKLMDKGDMVNLPARKGEMEALKQLLPALAERCRSWKHGENCEYESQGKIPLAEAMEENPLCSCGRGKDVEGMSKVALWSKLAPYVTRIALSPLFSVSYLESVVLGMQRERPAKADDIQRVP